MRHRRDWSTTAVFLVVTTFILWGGYLIVSSNRLFKSLDQCLVVMARLESIHQEIRHFKGTEYHTPSFRRAETEVRKLLDDVNGSLSGLPPSVTTELKKVLGRTGADIDALKRNRELMEQSIELGKPMQSVYRDSMYWYQSASMDEIMGASNIVRNQTVLVSRDVYRKRIENNILVVLACIFAAGIYSLFTGQKTELARRIETEKKLRGSESRYRNLIEQASDGIFISQIGGSFIDINPTGCELLGFRKEELLSMKPEDLFSARSADYLPYEEVRSELRSGNIIRYEREYVRRNGTVFPVEITARLMENDQVLSIFRDITDRKQYETQLIEARNRAEEMSRIKSAFLANMSHEIRTPLTAIIGYSEVLAEEVPEKDREYADIIRSGAYRLLDTLNSVLDLAQLEGQSLRLNPQEVDVIELLTETVALFSPRARKKNLFLELAPPPVLSLRINADRSALARVLTNLISNAIKFTTEGGVTVRVACLPEDICISIEDTGIGIGRDFFPHLFEEFAQESTGLARNYEGSGLGLTITKRLVTLMHGSVEVESRPAEGSTFSVRIPRIYIDKKDEPLLARPTQRSVGERRSLLLVEDDDVTRMLVTQLLGEQYTVQAVPSYRQAVELARKSSYDAVLLDINLGQGKNGIELLSTLRQMPGYQHTPAIAVTAYGLPGEESGFLGNGFNYYVKKPFSKEDLLSTVHTACEKKTTACKA